MEREKNISVWLPLPHPLLGTWPATQACALIGNRTGDPLVHRPTLNPLSHTSQGQNQTLCANSIWGPEVRVGQWRRMIRKKLICSQHGVGGELCRSPAPAETGQCILEHRWRPNWQSWSHPVSDTPWEGRFFGKDKGAGKKRRRQEEGKTR